MKTALFSILFHDMLTEYYSRVQMYDNVMYECSSDRYKIQSYCVEIQVAL